MKALLLGALLLASVPAMAQIRKPISAGSQLDTANYINQSGYISLSHQGSHDCAIAASLAEQDIQAGFIVLILASGDNVVVKAGDREFKAQFHVFYLDEGCLAPPKACMLAYNQRIFEYLQVNYGRKWRRTVRRDVVGYKQWKRQH